jgi:hypothetical protein
MKLQSCLQLDSSEGLAGTEESTSKFTHVVVGRISPSLVTRWRLWRIESCPPKRYVKAQSPVPVNVSLFGNRVFVDVVKLR